MSVRVGSARINEKGTTTGGSAGDSTGKEVAIQSWYLHTKGWVVIRAKDASTREAIAHNMESICNNDNIGYCQTHRTSLTTAAKPYAYDASKVTSKVEVDCSEAVRNCVMYAGVTVKTFTTANEKTVLKATGKFDVLTADKYCKSSDNLVRGDILVTKTKGHTVVVLDNGSGSTSTSSTTSTVKVDAAKSKDSSIAGTYKVTASGGLNLRSGAGTTKSVVKVLSSGVTVTCYGYYTAVGTTKWYLVAADGVTGFCSSKYLKKLT